MNNKGFLKVLMVSFVMSMAIGLLAGSGMAQVMPQQVMLQNQLGVLVGETVLLDNCEYWKDARSMGWDAVEPPYPIYGAGLGYGTFNTVLDFEEGSRVLDVYRPASAFLPFNPQMNYMPYTIMKNAAYMDANGVHTSIPGTFNNMSFKVRAPLSFEMFDTFSATIVVKSDAGGYANIVLLPKDKVVGCPMSVEDSVENKAAVLPDNMNEAPQIIAYAGRQFGDLSWHLVMVDLDQVIDTYTDGGEGLGEVLSVVFKGNQYRLDDIMFTSSAGSVVANKAPYLFRIGPVYATMWVQNDMRFIYAEDVDLGINYDPNGHFSMITDAAGVAHGQAGFDPNTTLTINNDNANLQFKWTVNGSLGSMAPGLAQPIAVDPNNPIIPFLPKFEAPMSAWVWNTGEAEMSENPMKLLAKALADSGYTYWPTVNILTPALGQVQEDLIVTCRITDGLGFDMETFPVSVVNYDVTNHPPLIEQLEDQIFEVNTMGIYQVTATDPDMQDMMGLTYTASLNGSQNYQYGPWQEAIIGPCTGTIALTPRFEGAMTCVVTVKDPRGAYAVGSFTIFASSPGTWFNHPPVVTSIIESPQSVTAGKTFLISDLKIIDPDNQPLYYSTNIGAVGANGVYTFQSNFSGTYNVQITAYDPMGGAVTQQFVLTVMPWWSY